MNNDNIVSHGIETSLGMNERESLNRPAWTSEEESGMFHSAEAPFWHPRRSVRRRKVGDNR